MRRDSPNEPTPANSGLEWGTLRSSRAADRGYLSNCLSLAFRGGGLRTVRLEIWLLTWRGDEDSSG